MTLSLLPVKTEQNKISCPISSDVSGPVASTFSKISGMNFLISKTLESQVKKQLDKALLGDFDVQIQPFGGLSMLQVSFGELSLIPRI